MAFGNTQCVACIVGHGNNIQSVAHRSILVFGTMTCLKNVRISFSQFISSPSFKLLLAHATNVLAVALSYLHVGGSTPTLL